MLKIQKILILGMASNELFVETGLALPLQKNMPKRINAAQECDATEAK
jgi:hypothetical protein